MINFKCNSKIEEYVARQLHLMLGISFDQEVYASFINTNDVSAIQLKLKNGKENLINTTFLKLCSDFLSLNREKLLPKDNLGRVLFSKKQAEEISLPLLDQEVIKIRELVEIFLSKNGLNYTKLSYSDGPSVCLTHDVDSLKSNSFLKFFYRLFKSLSDLDFSGFKTYLKKRSTIFNTHGDIQKFIQIEDDYDFKSTYFFLSLPFFLGREGRRYSINSWRVKKIINSLLNSRYEIGLHMSRKGYAKILVGRREIKRLQKASAQSSISGVRNHYLKGNFPKIWNLYEDLFEYDSSLGSGEYLIYRAGTSNPFEPYDYNLERKLDIIEVPLIIMDGAISGNCEKIFSTVKSHIDIAFRNKSIITILWHTDRILPDDFTQHSEAYIKILDYLNQLKFNSLTIPELVGRYKEYLNKMESNLNIIK